MERKLRGVLVDVLHERVQVREIIDNLDEFYKMLNCDCIDIVSRRIGKKTFDIVCDDEGLFKDPQKISAINNLGQPQLVGNLFIVAGSDIEGNLVSLANDDADYILGKIQIMGTRKFPNGYPMLTQCEY